MAQRLLQFSSGLLLASALAEFVLLRVVMRLGPVLPPGDAATAAMSWVFRFGVAALNLAAILVVPTLGILSYKAFKREGLPGAWPMGAAAGLAAAVMLLGSVQAVLLRGSGPPALPFIVSIVSLVVASLPLASAGIRGLALLPIGAALAAYGAAHYHYMSRSGAALGIALPRGTGAFAAAEGLALTVAPLALFAFRPGLRVGAAAAATAVTALAGGFYWSSPWMASALAIFDVAFTLYLPIYLYFAALWTAIYAVISLFAQPGARLAAIGLALMSLSGLKLDYLNYSLQGLTGFLLLAACLANRRYGEAVEE